MSKRLRFYLKGTGEEPRAIARRFGGEVQDKGHGQRRGHWSVYGCSRRRGGVAGRTSSEAEIYLSALPRGRGGETLYQGGLST